MTDLLQAVDALTLPISETITQPVYRTLLDENQRPRVNDNGDVIRVMVGERTVRLNHPPLLERLEAAITSTISRQGGGGADKHARNLLDSSALFEFMRIGSAITSWCAIVKTRATRHPAVDLRSWYAKRLSMPVEDDEFYVDQLYKWARTISSRLNQPRSWELAVPCPSCKAATWWDSVDDNGHTLNVERNRPITVEYWPDQLDIAATATARCRACGDEWMGEDALNRLKDDLEHTDETDVARDDENVLT